jgi:Cu/Ag efflux pump CusA
MMALGVIVHDAILDVHNIRGRLGEKRPEGKSVAAVVIDAAMETRSIMSFGIVIVLLLALPLMFVSGVLGEFLTAVAQSYAIAVLASLLVALFLTPALCLLILPESPGEIRHSPLSSALTGVTEKIASRFSAAAGKVYLLAGGALLAVVIGIPLLQADQFLPEFRETNLLINWNADPGTSQPEMSRITGRVVRELRAVPGVIDVGAHVGRAVTSDQVANIFSSQVWVSIDPKANYDASLAAIEAVVDGYPGIDADLTTYSEERIEAGMAGESNKLTVRIYGQDTDVLSLEAQKIKDVIAEVEGITEAEVERGAVLPTVEIRVDLERAKGHGIKPGDVRRSAATLLSGLEVGSLFEEKKVFDVVVWGSPDTRSSLSDIQNLSIATPSGEYIRLKEVADVGIKPHPTVIKREGVARYLDVEVDIYGRSAADVARHIEARLAETGFPMEYHSEILSNYRVQAANQQRALTATAAAIIGIFLLIQAAVRSWRLATIAVLSLPVSLVGGIVVVLIAGANFSLGSFLGMLLILGLAARLAIELLLHFQDLERREGWAFGPELVVRGTVQRAIPVVVTILVTAAVLVPFLLMTGAAGMAILGPLAGFALGGLVTTLVLILFILPVLYLGLGSGAPSDEEFEDLLGAASHAQ